MPAASAIFGSRLVGVMGDRALAVTEIIAEAGTFYDYESKYADGGSRHIIPARVHPDMYDRAMDVAVAAHRALGCRGATRVDMIVSESGNEFVLEVNTVPGLTPTSLLPKIADAAGISFGELCELMLAGAQLSCRRPAGERRIVQRPFVGDDRREPVSSAH